MIWEEFKLFFCRSTVPLSRLIGVKIHCPRLQIKRPTYDNTGKGRLFYQHSNLRSLFFSYLKYKNKLIIDIFVTGILSGLVSITGDSKMFMIFYLFIFYERIGLFQNTMILVVVPPTFCITTAFQLQLGLTTAPRGIENNWLMQNFEKTTKSIMVF